MNFDDILSEAFDLLETSMANKQKLSQAQLAQQKELALEQEQTKRMGYDNQVTLQDMQGQNNLEKQKLIDATQLQNQGLVNEGSIEEQRLKNLGQLDQTKIQNENALKLAGLTNNAQLEQIREKYALEAEKPDVRVLSRITDLGTEQYFGDAKKFASGETNTLDNPEQLNSLITETITPFDAKSITNLTGETNSMQGVTDIKPKELVTGIPFLSQVPQGQSNIYGPENRGSVNPIARIQKNNRPVNTQWFEDTFGPFNTSVNPISKYR